MHAINSVLSRKSRFSAFTRGLILIMAAITLTIVMVTNARPAQAATTVPKVTTVTTTPSPTPIGAHTRQRVTPDGHGGTIVEEWTTTETQPARPVGPVAMSIVSGGSPSVAGCMTLTVTYSRWHNFIFKHTLVYRFNLLVTPCWNHDHIVSKSRDAWYSNKSPFTTGKVFWTNSWAGLPGRPLDSRWNVFVRGELDQCVTKWGCILSADTWIHLVFNGNGTYYFDASGNG